MALLSGEVETREGAEGWGFHGCTFRMALLSGEVETWNYSHGGAALPPSFRMALLSGEVETHHYGQRPRPSRLVPDGFAIRGS